MRNSLIAVSLAFATAGALSPAFAQVGAGVVGSLGANGAISNFGTTRLGGDIGAGAQMNGTDIRGGANADARGTSQVRRNNASTGTSSSLGAGTNGTSVGAGATSGAAGATQTPVLSGSAWGSAQAGAQVAGPDVDSTKEKAKNMAKDDLNRVEQKRDKLESKGDKAADKSVDKL